jgi:deoxyribose-phosphate aldolase
MVLNVGLLKSGQSADYEAVRQDIRGVVELAHAQGAIVKVILETCLLTFEEKLRASEIALSAGADFLKTSTGFSPGGATADDITLLRGVAGTRAGVKASGGIRSSPTPPPCSAEPPASGQRQRKIVAELAGQAPTIRRRRLLKPLLTKRGAPQIGCPILHSLTVKGGLFALRANPFFS